MLASVPKSNSYTFRQYQCVRFRKTERIFCCPFLLAEHRINNIIACAPKFNSTALFLCNLQLLYKFAEVVYSSSVAQLFYTLPPHAGEQ